MTTKTDHRILYIRVLEGQNKELTYDIDALRGELKAAKEKLAESQATLRWLRRRLCGWRADMSSVIDDLPSAGEKLAPARARRST